MSSTGSQSPYGYGFCHCGCGGKTTIPRYDNAAFGHVQGEPLRFINGHNRRKAVHWQPEDRGHETECWIWVLHTDQRGYARLSLPSERVGGDTVCGHRHYWGMYRGPIPEGHAVHHVCRQRACVNPDHLELMERSAHGRLHALEMAHG